MLIPTHLIRAFLTELKIPVKGALHIGAHSCEEVPVYVELGVDKVLWLEAIEEQVAACRKLGLDVHQAVLSDREEEVVFHISNNGQSSSLLEFGTHSDSYPDIVITEERPLKTTTLTKWFQNNPYNPSDYNLWNLDIQGAELLALKGGQEFLQFVDVLYLEVNEAEVYKGCATLEEMDAFLLSHGFTRAYTVMTAEKWGDALYLRLPKNH